MAQTISTQRDSQNNNSILTFEDLQKTIYDFEIVKWLAHESVLHKCLILTEEIWELYKAMRKTQWLKLDPNSKVDSIEDEMADVFILLASIANRLSIDIWGSIESKMAKNNKREWI